MPDETTPQTADNALQQQAATTTETTTPIEAAPSTNQRPYFIPEKFWDAQKGEAKLDQLAINYDNLDRHTQHAILRPILREQLGNDACSQFCKANGI